MAQVAERYVGSPVLRKEDAELVTGHGKYTDDLVLPGMVYLHMVRSPLAHARIKKVDVSKALAVPGVVAAFSGADLESEWAGPLPLAWPVTEDIKNPPFWPVTKDKARYQGEIVAAVVVHPDPAHRSHHDGGLRAWRAREQAPRDRAPRRRRVRLEDPCGAGRGVGARAGAPAGSAREVDRDAVRELPRHAPRPRHVA